MAYIALNGFDRQVADVQAKLNALGMSDERGQALVVDGITGAHTQAAITKFWSSRGVSMSPAITPDLIAALGLGAGVAAQNAAGKTGAMVGIGAALLLAWAARRGRG